ncbi:MAG: ABC transporter ATP-binding protein [Pleurocapsa minor GSE-CHR-MK-17-07R]|jgi:peptide/nickel transport system ATP-binding protein|nr:ABC transporter ATP-binding protein [Pleurocapsa minor GSE-CHR-MK 17-07R]
MSGKPVIQVRDLTLEYKLKSGWTPAIRDISLTVYEGQIHGLVGESGSGKSTLALGLMRYMAANARITAGTILFDGQDITHLPQNELRKLWGKHISLVPQDALAALNPSLKIGQQIAEIVRLHEGISSAEAHARAVEMLNQVRIPDPEQVSRRYAHQISGGQQQRVTIAMALIARPKLLILDEPTTSLDVTTQASIIELVRDLMRERNAAALYVSHDLGVVAQLCDHVTVLYGGEVMATAPVVPLFTRPIHPYTISLLASLPRHTQATETRLRTIEGAAPALDMRTTGCAFAARCPAALDKCHAARPPLEDVGEGPDRYVRCHRWREIADGTLVIETAPGQTQGDSAPLPGHVLKAHDLNKTFNVSGMFELLTEKERTGVRALNDVSISIRARSTLGVVGESGSGKTTLARAIIGLEPADDGTIDLMNQAISLNLNGRTRDELRQMQMIFQNPNDSLNPYRTVGDALARTIKRLSPDLTRDAVRARVLSLLEAVRLTPDYANRFPNELSGGEKQRVGIARAFAAQPSLVIADEPTSALDVSVQAVILNLLKDLRAREGVSYLFISHDLRAVSYLADWIVVMYLGQIVEVGDADQVYALPSHPYTEALLSALPTPDPTVNHMPIVLEGDPPSPRNLPTGCPFHTRCPRKIGKICETDAPPWQDAGGDHAIRCHIPADELLAIQSKGAP